MTGFRFMALSRTWAEIANTGHFMMQGRPLLQICTVTYSLFSFDFPLLI
jgi:hypothetical protein